MRSCAPLTTILVGRQDVHIGGYLRVGLKSANYALRSALSWCSGGSSAAGAAMYHVITNQACGRSSTLTRATAWAGSDCGSLTC
jgi:hypothetical protein